MASTKLLKTTVEVGFMEEVYSNKDYVALESTIDLVSQNLM